MINAEIVPLQNETFLVRFSNPDETFAKKTFSPVKSRFDVQRQLDFLNRKYIVDTLQSWINQRIHALKLESEEIKQVQCWLKLYKNASLQNICLFVTRKEALLKTIAPCPASSCFPYYLNTIIPIINFSTGADENQETQIQSPKDIQR